VVDLASFNAAVATLRSPAGHDISPAGVAAWTTPPLWSKVELTLATTDISAPSEEIDGNVNATIASLASIGFVPLVVTQVSCASFDFATMDNTQAAYWGERWCARVRGALQRLCDALAEPFPSARRELYKHQYILSRYTWVRGIRKIECAQHARTACCRRTPPLTHPRPRPHCSLERT
jgi:hypothetical protein